MRSQTVTAQPLTPDVICIIVARHERAQDGHGSPHDHFHQQLLYRVQDGALVGSSGMAEAQDALPKLLAVSSHHRLVESELLEVRLLPDGTVTQSDVMRHADPVDLRDDPPDVPPRLRPASVVGERIASLIRIRHSERVPQHVLNPGLGRSSSFVMPPEDLLYSPTDARLLGSAMALDGRENAHRAVRISTHELPTVERIAAVVVDERGNVGDLP